MSKLNPNEAPKGFIAKPYNTRTGCKKCAFRGKVRCYNVPCYTSRKDGRNVYFVKKEPPCEK